MIAAIQRHLLRVTILVATASPVALPGQNASSPVTVTAADSIRLPADAAPVPFRVGEKLEYELKYGLFGVGKGEMEVRDLVDVGGAISWHTVLRLKGGIIGFRVNDLYESWFDVTTLTTRRFHQELDEGTYEAKRHYEFFHERGTYKENDKPEQPTVEMPLDDASFLYFVRTIPLNVGETYSFSRYFKPDANPVSVTVVRRETIKVPAGTFSTVVLRPKFKTKGLFSENGRAEVWISDDDRRIMVQMKSKLKIGSIHLLLRKHNTGTAK